MPQPFSIQIVDDGLNLGRELCGWLEQAGYVAVCAPPSRALLGTLASQPPGLLLIGLHDTNGPGYEFYERLQSHRQLRHLPVIVVSTDADLEYEFLDTYDFHLYPLERPRLLNAVAKAAALEPARLIGHFASEQLELFKPLLFQRSGLHFSASNWRLLERGLQRRMQALQIHAPKKYYDYLSRSGENQDEFNKLVGLLTVGETCFFRYRSHHDALIHSVFPDLLARNSGTRRLRLWSAGCSTGEEPYSLAIKLLEHFPQLVDWDVQILATDINKRALRLAREGGYRERALRQAEERYRQRYFRNLGDLFVIEPRVRNLVKFAYLNLQEPCFPEPGNGTAGLDLILCRNVLIYFLPETIKQVVARFAAALNPGGYLLLGHAETLQYISDRFTRHHQHGAFYYQLKAPAAARLPAVVVTPAPPPGLPVTAVAAIPKPQLASPAMPPAKARPAVVPTPAAVALTPAMPVTAEPAALYRQAVAAFDREEFTVAEQLFDQVLVSEPEHSRALVGKGLLSANRGDYQEARQWCARAIRFDDLCPEAYLLRGLILDMEGAVERALVEYQKVLWLERDFVMAHYLSSKCHGQLGHSEQRQRALRNALRCLEKNESSTVVPFSGGLSRPVLLEQCRRELQQAS